MAFERIIVKFFDKVPQAKAFYGRWIIPPDDPFARWEGEREEREERVYYALALTSRGNVVIFNFLGSEHGEEEYPSGKFFVYESFDEAAANSSTPNISLMTP